MQPLMPFIVLLIVAVIVNYIPMESTLKAICFVIVGVAAIFLLLRFIGIA